MATVNRSIVLLVFFAACAAMAGCNTVEGIGQDLQSGGKAIEDAAD